MNRRSFWQRLIAVFCLAVFAPRSSVFAAKRRRHHKIGKRHRYHYRRRVRHGIKKTRVPIRQLY